MLVLFTAIISICLTQVRGSIPQDEVIDVPVPDNDTGLFETDIRFTEEQLSSFRRSAFNVLRVTSDKRWGVKGTRGAKVPYTLSSEYSNEEKNKIKSALWSLSSLTRNCIRFVPRTTQRNYLYIYKGFRCWSFIGRALKERQLLSIDNSCLTTGDIQHQILHALGFWHEHNRADRDEYIRVQWTYIFYWYWHVFKKTSWTYTATYGQPYDYTSLMHFDKFTHNRSNHGVKPPKDRKYKGSRTMVSKDPSQPIAPGESPSKIDIFKLKALYQC